jgi:vitamin B12 transporter
MTTSFGYKFNTANSIKIYSQFFDSERHFSPSIEAVSNSKYQDLNTRNLIEFENKYSQFTTKIKVAFLTERYKYFDNYNNPNFTGSTAETFISKYDLNYKLGKKTEINTIFDLTKTKSFGNSIGQNTRQIGSVTVLFKTLFLDKLLFESSLRKEQSDVYKSPFLYSLGLKHELNKYFNWKLNVSKNFRIPTFNDLYWIGSGNINLQPETSKQVEFGQEIVLKNFSLSATTYYSKTENLIQWTPIYGNWSPKNIGNTTNYGLEIYSKLKHHFGNNHFEINSSYAYTKAKDNETNLVLIYVPKHKINGELVYNFNKFTANYQYLFNGYVFTSLDNQRYLKEYQLSNIGLNYAVFKKNTINFGIQILNIWNKNYQTVEARPMPRRNFNLNINFKF